MSAVVTNGKDTTSDPMAAWQEDERGLPGEVSGTVDAMPPRIDNDAKLQAVQLAVWEAMLAKLQNGGKNGNGKWWLSPALVVLGLVGGVFGIQYVPRSQSETDKQIVALVTKLEQNTEDHNKLEKLRTLYLIRFGEDPDTVDPQTMRKPQQRRQ